MIMDVAFSAAKDKLNRVKHGVSLAEAALFDWAHAVKWEDERKDYGETRVCAVGEINRYVQRTTQP